MRHNMLSTAQYQWGILAVDSTAMPQQSVLAGGNLALYPINSKPAKFALAAISNVPTRMARFSWPVWQGEGHHMLSWCYILNDMSQVRS